MYEIGRFVDTKFHRYSIVNGAHSDLEYLVWEPKSKADIRDNIVI